MLEELELIKEELDAEGIRVVVVGKAVKFESFSNLLNRSSSEPVNPSWIRGSA